MYTRKGDGGETSLYGPRRVSKDSPRVDAYGTIDELNSLLGLVAAGCEDRKLLRELVSIQKMLFVAGSDLATDEGGPQRVPRITHHHTAMIETMTDGILKTLPTLNSFILPGGNRTASELQLARAVCRRAERRVVAASKGGPANPELIPFLNRLSSYLFNAARRENRRARRKELSWSAATNPG